MPFAQAQGFSGLYLLFGCFCFDRSQARVAKSTVQDDVSTHSISADILYKYIFLHVLIGLTYKLYSGRMELADTEIGLHILLQSVQSLIYCRKCYAYARPNMF